MPRDDRDHHLDRRESGRHPLSPRVQHLLLTVALGAIVATPWFYWGTFAGDAQVHLVFAENAAHGRFFEFNQGQRVSGETSPGYMLVGAALFRLLPAVAVPVALKLINLAAWYWLCWLVYRVAARLLSDTARPDDRFWPTVAALIAAAMPGSVYNANVGMENGLFAAVVWLWVDLAGRWGWLNPKNPAGERSLPSIGHEIALSLLLGITCWLRPEGFVVIALAYAVQLRVARPAGRTWLMGLLVALVVGISSLAFQLAYTGDLVPTSVLSRRLLSMRHSWSLGPLLFDPTFTKRLVLYLPLTTFFVLGAVDARRHRSGIEILLFGIFVVFFLLYSFVSGTAQLGRYVIFLMPTLAIGAATGARNLWEGRHRHGPRLLGIALSILAATDVGESWYRRRLFSQDLLANAMTAPEQRRARTDALLHDLGDPSKRPVTLALEPVQVRYELDERMTIRSFDGRVDRALMGFVRTDFVDQAGYLRTEDIDYFFLPPSYDRHRQRWALTDLDDLKPGQSANHGGLGFRRLPSGAFSVARGPATSDRGPFP